MLGLLAARPVKRGRGACPGVDGWATIRKKKRGKPDQALLVLRDVGYDAITEDAVVINVKDRPGALAQVTRRLQEAGVGMRSMRILHRQAGEAMVAISMDRSDDAMRLIDDLLVNRGQ